MKSMQKPSKRQGGKQWSASGLDKPVAHENALRESALQLAWPRVGCAG